MDGDCKIKEFLGAFKLIHNAGENSFHNYEFLNDDEEKGSDSNDDMDLDSDYNNLI